jgi:hypothetical protein
MELRDLVRTYEPVLRFSCDGEGKEENFFPMAVEHYVSASRLCRRGQGTLPEKPQLETLEAMSPLASRDFYLAYAAAELLSHDPTFSERLRHGGLALFSIDGDITPHLVVDSSEAFSFAMQDAGLEGEGPVDPASLSFSGPGGEVPTASFRIRDVPRLPATIRDEALQRYAQHRDFDAHPPVYYYHVTANRGYLVIQYWFFYAYNDWGTSHGGVNDHEGDWESIFVFLQNEKPAYVAFSAHNGPPQLLAWDNLALERFEHDHPIACVGCGSHAAYAGSDVHRYVGGIADHHRGDGEVTVGPGAAVSWGEPVDLARAPWALNFAGGWGALVKRWGASWLSPGAQAPTGPVWHYAQWESPVQWARVPH